MKLKAGNQQRKAMKPKAGSLKRLIKQGFPGGTVVMSLPANAGGTGLIPGQGRSTCHVAWPKK